MPPTSLSYVGGRRVSNKDVGPEASLVYLTRPDTLRLHLGEMSAQELRTAQAAIRLALSSHAQEMVEREHIKELKRLCAQTYQVVGALASECDRFEDEAVQKALDNLSQLRIVHDDVLPFV
jgi:hypothetical protein